MKGSARASRAVFGALAKHTFRSARAPTGAAEAAALPDAIHTQNPTVTASLCEAAAALHEPPWERRIRASELFRPPANAPAGMPALPVPPAGS
jgi:hypothetical protein